MFSVGDFSQQLRSWTWSLVLLFRVGTLAKRHWYCIHKILAARTYQSFGDCGLIVVFGVIKQWCWRIEPRFIGSFVDKCFMNGGWKLVHPFEFFTELFFSLLVHLSLVRCLLPLSCIPKEIERVLYGVYLFFIFNSIFEMPIYLHLFLFGWTRLIAQSLIITLDLLI